VLCTFSAADLAVGWWYRAASSLARQDTEAAASGIWIPLAAQGSEYGFQPGQFYLLVSSAVIKTDQSQFSGAHSDIRHPEVVRPVVDASR